MYKRQFQMNNDVDRGWIWRYDGQAVSDGAMSLTTSGKLKLKILQMLVVLLLVVLLLLTHQENGLVHQQV